jgi:preprotein translocase subunit SecA
MMASRSNSSAGTGSATGSYVGDSLFGSITVPSKGRRLFRKVEKQGRNDACACGSEKKFKFCCGRQKEPGLLMRFALCVQKWLQ